MPRRAKFSEQQILDVAGLLAADKGPGAATIGAIGAILGAPSGSIYHRFPTRDVLLGRLWLSKAAFFQNRFVEALAHDDPVKAGLEAGLSLPRAVREDLGAARIMMLHRREDFLSGDWPRDMTAEARRLTEQVDEALRRIAKRLFNSAAAKPLRLATLVVLDVPFAAVRRHVSANEVPPPYVDELIASAFECLVQPSARKRRKAHWLG
jgi:AcrR family transcriptional regulator